MAILKSNNRVLVAYDDTARQFISMLSIVPTQSQRNFLDKLYKGLKATGLFQFLLEGYCFLGATEADYQINIKTLTRDATFNAFNAGVQVRTLGWRSNASRFTGLADDTNIDVNNFTYAVYVTEYYNNATDMGSRQVNNNKQQLISLGPPSSTGFCDVVQGNGTSLKRVNNPISTNGLGFLACSSNSGGVNVHTNGFGVTSGKSTATVGLATGKVGYGNLRDSTGGWETTSDKTYGFMGAFNSYLSHDQLQQLFRVIELANKEIGRNKVL